MNVRRDFALILVFFLPQLVFAETGPCFEWANAMASEPEKEADDPAALKARIATLEACVLELVTEHAEIGEDGDEAPPERPAQEKPDAGDTRDPGTPEIKQLAAANRVRAPFEVVDESGRVIFQVAVVNGQPGMTVGQSGGKHVSVGLNKSGPVIALYDRGHAVAKLGVDEFNGGYNLQIDTASEQKVYVGNSPVGNGFYYFDNAGSGGVGDFGGDRPIGLRILNSTGEFVTGAGLNQDHRESGQIVVRSPGITLANITANPTGGSIQVFSSAENGAQAAIDCTVAGNGKCVAHVLNASGQSVARLQESSNGGGNVTVADPGGEGVFSAGAATDGGGEACLNRVTGGGQARNVCLGIELPSMGLGK